MSCSATLPTLTLTAGQVWDMPVTFTDAAGAALDLTGATVYLVAKASLSEALDDLLGQALLWEFPAAPEPGTMQS